MKKGATNDKVRGLRTALIAIESALGKSISDIAKEYGVTKATVQLHLQEAEQSGFIEHFRSLAFDRLASKAMAVYEARLVMGDLDAARDIAFGLGILHKEAKPQTRGKQASTLDAYRQSRKEHQDAQKLERHDLSAKLYN